jgi:hypothetical protein
MDLEPETELQTQMDLEGRKLFDDVPEDLSAELQSK